MWDGCRILMIALVAFVAGSAAAQPGYYGYDPLDPQSFGMFARPLHDDTGFASAWAVRNAVGDVRFHLTCSEPRGTLVVTERDRDVRVYLSDGPNHLPEQSVLNTIVGAALNRAFEECPAYWHNVNSVELYSPSSELLLRAHTYLGMFGKWEEVTDVRAERAAEEERQRQRAAEKAAQAEREVVRQRAYVARQETARRNAAAFWFWVTIAGGALGVLYLWSKREAIAGFFYSLTPHPATDMVERAVYGQGDIDGELFASIMRPVPGSRAEQRVRAEQAQRLAAMARAAAERRTEQLKRERDSAVQDAAFVRAQDELRSAAEEHELAKARLDALRKWKDRNVR